MHTEQTELHRLCRTGSVADINELISKGFDVNTVDCNGETPLVYSCWLGRLDVCKCLLDNHADPNIRDFDGISCLSEVVYRSYTDLYGLLLKNGARILNDSFALSMAAYPMRRWLALSLKDLSVVIVLCHMKQFPERSPSCRMALLSKDVIRRLCSEVWLQVS